MDIIKDFFNNLASTWDNKDNNYQIIEFLLEKANIKEDEDVLDLACGKGVITSRIYNYTNKLVDGIDIAENMIADAKKINPETNKYNFICDDFYTYEFNKKYDKIIIFNAYPHFLDVNMLSKKAYDLLKENGKLIIMHDLTYQELNSHHKAKAMGVSRYIGSPLEEYESFKDLYNLDDNLDQNMYLMILTKK